jgi:uncharacterized protein (TIGR03067 family)
LKEAKVRTLLAIGVLAATPLLALAQTDGRSGQEVIQGVWKWTSGDAVAIFEVPSPILKFDDTKAVVLDASGQVDKTGRFELFPAANPPEMVLTLLDRARNRKWERKAAYEVTEKSLKLCFHSQPMQAPTCRTAAIVLDFHR